jgi:cytochrome c heme-lyase
MSSVTDSGKAPINNEDHLAKCPVNHSTRSTWQNLASLPSDHPLPPSAKPLSTKREISSIPRGPSGQNDSTEAEGGGKWVYPSESQFYAALLRKHQAAPSTVSASKSSHGKESTSTTVTLGVKDHEVAEVDTSGAAVTNGNVVKPPRADDMRVVVPIHNAVNEQTWAKVLQWEAEQGGQS